MADERIKDLAFDDWLIRQRYRQDAIGRLARFLSLRDAWPTDWADYAWFETYLKDNGKEGRKLLPVLCDSWEEWRRQVEITDTGVFSRVLCHDGSANENGCVCSGDFYVRPAVAARVIRCPQCAKLLAKKRGQFNDV